MGNKILEENNLLLARKFAVWCIPIMVKQKYKDLV